MAKRRSVADALELTPQKVAFITKGTGPAEAITVQPGEIANPQSAELRRPCEDPEIRPDSPVQRKRAPEAAPPAALLPHLLVPLNTRLQPETAHALRRAYLEQKLRGQRAATQQKIVEEALQGWLKRHGLLD